MSDKTNQLVERGKNFCWWDRRAVKYLVGRVKREKFYLYRGVYLALVELESDRIANRFKKPKPSMKLDKVCFAYSGIPVRLVRPIMKDLRDMGLIDYSDNGSLLAVFDFDDSLPHLEKFFKERGGKIG